MPRTASARLGIVVILVTVMSVLNNGTLPVILWQSLLIALAVGALLYAYKRTPLHLRIMFIGAGIVGALLALWT
jgi:hypothetical protein